MGLIRFIFSKIFIKHIIIAMLFTITVIWLTLFILKIYTEHNKYLLVPDFKGLTLCEVDTLCKELHLRYEIIDSVYLADKIRGSIIEQVPAPDTKVKKYRRIFLTINSFYPERIRMPDVREISVRQARAILESYALNIGELEYVPSEYKNLVLEQKYNDKVIEPNTLIEKGAYIDLVVGQGLSNEKTVVPDLIGLTIAQAIEKLKDNYLNIGASLYDETVRNTKDSINAKIWKQQPEYNEDKKLRLGTLIDIWLTIDTTKIKR